MQPGDVCFWNCLIARTRSRTKLTRLPLSSTTTIHLIGRSPLIIPPTKSRVSPFTSRVPLHCTAYILVFNDSNLLVTHQRVSAEARGSSTIKFVYTCIAYTRESYSTGSNLHCFRVGPRPRAREPSITHLYLFTSIDHLFYRNLSCVESREKERERIHSSESINYLFYSNNF